MPGIPHRAFYEKLDLHEKQEQLNKAEQVDASHGNRITEQCSSDLLEISEAYAVAYSTGNDLLKRLTKKVLVDYVKGLVDSPV